MHQFTFIIIHQQISLKVLHFHIQNSLDVVSSHHQIPGKSLFFSFRKLTLMEAQFNSLPFYLKIATNLVDFYEHLRKIGWFL